jgi:hypothetical protein
MALFMNQENTRTELQKRLAAELAEKAKKKDLADVKPLEELSDKHYLKGTKQTTSLAWVWVLIVIATIGVILWLIIYSRA